MFINIHLLFYIVPNLLFFDHTNRCRKKVKRIAPSFWSVINFSTSWYREV